MNGSRLQWTMILIHSFWWKATTQATLAQLWRDTSRILFQLFSKTQGSRIPWLKTDCHRSLSSIFSITSFVEMEIRMKFSRNSRSSNHRLLFAPKSSSSENRLILAGGADVYVNCLFFLQAHPSFAPFIICEFILKGILVFIVSSNLSIMTESEKLLGILLAEYLWILSFISKFV